MPQFIPQFTLEHPADPIARRLAPRPSRLPPDPRTAAKPTAQGLVLGICPAAPLRWSCSSEAHSAPISVTLPLTGGMNPYVRE